MKKITLITILITTFATQSFAHCPIPQWCPKADLHQTLCPGEQIEEIEFPSVIAKTLVITWWMNETRTNFRPTPPPGITVSGDASTPLGEREYAFPVSIKGAPTDPGTHHYTVSNTCGVELLHCSITLAGPPTIGTVTPIGERYTVVGTAFTPLTLTDDPISSMLPITIQWYSNTSASNSGGIAVSGSTGNTFTPPATIPNAPDGIYYYAVATDGCGSTVATTNTSGKHIVGPVCPASTNLTGDNGCSPTRNGPTFTEGIGTQFFKTNTVWTISGNGISQEWSDVVLTSSCSKTGFAGGADPNFNNDCRGNRTTGTNETRPTAVNQGGNTSSAYLGDLFSWCAVMTHAAVLCPGTWRVPTCQDFVNLDVALGGTGINRGGADAVRDKFIDVSGDAGQFWGGAYVGYSSSTGTLLSQGSFAGYWSSSESTATYTRFLHFAGGNIYPQNSSNKTDGLALRCVR